MFSTISQTTSSLTIAGTQGIFRRTGGFKKKKGMKIFLSEAGRHSLKNQQERDEQKRKYLKEKNLDKNKGNK